MSSIASSSRRSARRIAAPLDDGDDLMGMEPLVDTTQPLALSSKRTERLRKRLAKLAQRRTLRPTTQLLDLPVEILLHTFTFLPPSSLLALNQVCKPLLTLISHHESALAKDLIATRYPALAQCFRLPVLLSSLDPSVHPYLRHSRPYRHVPPPAADLICGCVTCHLRWVALCTAVDFAHWRGHLERGEAIPEVPRAQLASPPTWAQRVLVSHAAKVRRALGRPLWYARLLEAHLESTISAIRRHAKNQGNRRKRFLLTAEDERSGSDAFLQREGPPTVEVPYQRDQYYLLEAFMPGRSWIKELGRWVYVPEEQHEVDSGLLVMPMMGREARRVGEATAQATQSAAHGAEVQTQTLSWKEVEAEVEVVAPSTTAVP